MIHEKIYHIIYLELINMYPIIFLINKKVFYKITYLIVCQDSIYFIQDQNNYYLNFFLINDKINQPLSFIQQKKIVLDPFKIIHFVCIYIYYLVK